MKSLQKIFLSIATSLMLFMPLISNAEPQDNNHALAGVKNGDVLFDITLSNPAMLTAQMGVIFETYQDLQASGIKPKMVLAFHGQNVHFLTNKLDSVAMEDINQVELFNEGLNKLMALDGVRVEACAIAVRLFGTDRAGIRKGINVVGNTYVSNIGYSKQGYTIITIQ